MSGADGHGVAEGRAASDQRGAGRLRRGAPDGGRVIGALGPTGVGKTAVAIELARILGTRIISCDSMQVYRGFPVLTNQPSPEELLAARHELVGCLEPGTSFSAVDYACLARPLIEADLAEAGCALLVGGTGLYMRAALAPLAAPMEADPVLRAELERRATVEGADVLHAELAGVDPAAAQEIDPRNVRRVIRALEAVRLTGQSWSGREDLWAPAYHYPTTIVGLVMDRAELYRHVDDRAVAIVVGGAIEEVRRFRESVGRIAGEPGGPGIRSAIGYPEICRHLDGELTLEDTVALIAAATRRYARRQLTWLRKLRDAVIIDVQDRDSRDVAREIADRAL